MTAPVSRDSENLFTLMPGLKRSIAWSTAIAVVTYCAWLLYADLGRTLATVRNTSIVAALVGLVLSTGNYALRWVRWHAYLKQLGIQIPRSESAVVFVAGFSMTVTPAKMGEILKSLLLKRAHDVPYSVSAPIILAERATDLAGLVLLVAVGSMAFTQGWPIAAGGAAIVGIFLVVSSWPALADLVLRLVDRIPVANRFTDSLRDAYASLRTMNEPVVLLQATALSTIAWGLQCLGLWVIARSVAPGAISVLESAVAYSAPLLAGTLAMIPGGLGLTEASMTGVLVALSDGALNTASASAVALLVRFVTFWWAIALGVLALVVWKRRYDPPPADEP